MNSKTFVVTEHYYAKDEYFEDVMNILIETSAMIEKVDGALMSMSLKPAQKNGAITAFNMWESREKFLAFMKSEHAEEIMKSGLAEKVKSWTTKISAEQYTVEQAWHIESHD